MTYTLESALGDVCPECGYADGHEVTTCPRVLRGEAKMMPGLPPEAVERLRGYCERRPGGRRCAVAHH